MNSGDQDKGGCPVDDNHLQPQIQADSVRMCPYVGAFKQQSKKKSENITANQKEESPDNNGKRRDSWNLPNDLGDQPKNNEPIQEKP